MVQIQLRLLQCGDQGCRSRKLRHPLDPRRHTRALKSKPPLIALGSHHLEMRFRQITFWLHLIAGLIAGVVILIMSATGVALAFEKEIIAWAERDVRRVAPPQAGTQRLGLDELLNTLREQRPGGRPSTIILDSDASAAVLIGFGRTNTFYVDPYTGAVRDQGA